MARRRLAAEIRPPAPPTIDPNAIYSWRAAYALLGIAPETLTAMLHNGEIRYRPMGKRKVFLGAWLLAWLEAGALPAKG